MIFNPNKQLIPFHDYKHWHYTDSQCKDNEKFILTLKRFSLYHLSHPVLDFDEVIVELFKINGDFVTSNCFQNQLYYDQETGQTFVDIDFNTDTVRAGIYYVVIRDKKYADLKFYSEPFCVKENYQPEFTLSWSNECIKIGNVIYPKTEEGELKFQKLHIDDITVVLGDTVIEEEVEENKFGVETIVSTLINQRYFFSFVVPFYLSEALTTLIMHSDVYLERRNDYTKKMLKCEVLQEPDDFGCATKVTVRFETNKVLKAGCCDEGVMNKKINYNPDNYSDDDYSTT